MGTDDEITREDITDNATSWVRDSRDTKVTLTDAFKAGAEWALARTAPLKVSRETTWEFTYYVRMQFEPYACIRFTTIDAQDYDGNIQAAIEDIYEDPGVMRVYQLKQCYGIGRRRGE